MQYLGDVTLAPLVAASSMLLEMPLPLRLKSGSLLCVSLLVANKS